MVLAAGLDTRAFRLGGPLQYLPADAEHALFQRIDALSAPGSRLAAERTAELASLAGDERLREVGIRLDALLSARDRPDPAGLLAERGWAVAEEPITAYRHWP